MTLTDFLLARIAEDEEAAHAAGGATGAPWSVDPVGDIGNAADVLDVNGWAIARATTLTDHARHIARHDPTRVLAECEAKRRIVGNHPHRVDSADVALGCETCHNGYTDGYCITYRALALPYADHPDYRDEWRVASK